jgi:hypothetical protein
MIRQPGTVRLTHGLILLNALIWLLFAVIVASGSHPSMPATPFVRWGVSALALGCAVCLAGLARLLMRPSKWTFWAAESVLVLLGLATIVDQVGWVDMVFLVITLLPALLLLKDRTWYMRA